jgi:capsular polysaccharide biosynthesis protein
MSDNQWRVDPADPDVLEPADQQPTLVSLHYIRTELRRRWPTWIGIACIGMFLGFAWTIVIPSPSTGTVTLMLKHDPYAIPDQAMATDMSLLRTRTVASEVVEKLGLTTTPEAFQNSVTATPESSNVLRLEVNAPNGEAAVTRARVLSDTYLAFRTDQIRSQTDALIAGYEKRIAVLQGKVAGLTQQYNAVTGSSSRAQNRAADILSERARTTSELNALQQTVQDTLLTSSSIIAASHVIDPASVVPGEDAKRLTFAVASGLIGGTAVGVGLVLFTALTSDRLRRREEVALALGVPVRFSAGSLSRARRPWFGSRAERNLAVLVHGLDSGISARKMTSRQASPDRKRTTRKATPERLALAGIENVEVAQQVVAAEAAALSRRGLSVFVVDLTEAGRLEQAVKKALDHDRRLDADAPAETPEDESQPPPVVFRPDEVPSLARGPIGSMPGVSTDLPKNDPMRPAWDAADVILTLAEVDLAVGADHLKSWTDQAILLVTAGRSGAERLRTTAELLRLAGIRLPFAMMVGADRTDESLGVPDAPETPWQGARRTS